MEYGGHGAGFYLLKAYFMNINFCRISFQPGATYLHETSSSNILQDGKLGASFLKSLCLFGRALGGGNKTLGCYHDNMDRVFWFCLSVASSLCLHLDPVSWLAEVFTFLDKKSQPVPPMAAEEKSLVRVLVFPRGLLLYLMLTETLVCPE